MVGFSDDSQAWALVEGDALGVLAQLPEASIDTVIADPPYGISFHDEAWDGIAIRGAAGKGQAEPALPEAFERFTCRWAHLCARVLKPGGHLLAFGAPRTFHRLVSGVEDSSLEIRDQLLWLFGRGLPKSRRLQGGLGSTLKPAYEPILLARKPLVGTTVGNLDRYGTGALNVDAARIDREVGQGYWPANVVLSRAAEHPTGIVDCSDDHLSRLFYCAKATHAERELGCEELSLQPNRIYSGKHHPARLVRNIHPTVKPLDLMRWLVRLTVPADGLILDPFAGSGTTGVAALHEGRRFLGIEREQRYVDIACARITHAAKGRA